MTALANLCEQYLAGEMRPAVFEVMVEGQAIKYPIPQMSTFYRQVERTINEHRCAFWEDCKPFCRFEGVPELWEDWISDVSPLYEVNQEIETVQ